MRQSPEGCVPNPKRYSQLWQSRNRLQNALTGHRHLRRAWGTRGSNFEQLRLGDALTMLGMEVTRRSNGSTGATLRAWYSAPIAEFLQAEPLVVLGELTAKSDFALIPTQRDAWMAEINFLHTCLAGLTGSLFLEFSIPRMGRRIDAVIVVGPVVFV